jgi:hypothetical protein
MSETFSRALVALAVVAGLGIAGPAAAAVGDGVRLGGSEARLHPFVEILTRYDSNVFFDGRRIGDMIFHVRPGLDLVAPGDLAAVDLTAALDWARYAGSEGETVNLSKLYAEAALGITLNRSGALGLEIDDQFRRGPSTSVLSFGSAVIANSNALRVRAPWKPGGGALVVALGGEWRLETFEPYGGAALCDPVTGAACDARLLDDLGYDELRGGADLRWRFLPRTSAVLETGYFARLPSSGSVERVTGVEARAGLTGLVTPQLATTLKAGWANTVGPGPEFGTWLATLDVEWLPMVNGSLRAGYGHGFGIEPGGTFAIYEMNRVAVGGRYALPRRYALRADVEWERRDYEAAGGASAQVVRVGPAVEGALARWMRLTAGYTFTRRETDFPGVTLAGVGLDYDKHEVWMRLGVVY